MRFSVGVSVRPPKVRHNKGYVDGEDRQFPVPPCTLSYTRKIPNVLVYCVFVIKISVNLLTLRDSVVFGVWCDAAMMSI